jgi:hypothetical protein
MCQQSTAIARFMIFALTTLTRIQERENGSCSSAKRQFSRGEAIVSIEMSGQVGAASDGASDQAIKAVPVNQNSTMRMD